MAKRKTVDTAESAPVVAEPKSSVRKATRPKSTATSAAHKHHAPIAAEPVAETPVTSYTANVVTHESIAHLAYALWESRGSQHGSADQDWLEAERQLLKLA